MTPERGRREPAAAGFQPLRPNRSRAFAIVLWPLVWIVALVVLAEVLRRRDAVELALVVALVSFVVALAYLAPQRLLRARREGGE